MSIQTVFQTGNSRVVSIPTALLSDLKIKTGDKVIVEKFDENTLVVKKAHPKSDPKKFSQTEFKHWLNNVLMEDAEILDELADR